MDPIRVKGIWPGGRIWLGLKHARAKILHRGKKNTSRGGDLSKIKKNLTMIKI